MKAKTVRSRKVAPTTTTAISALWIVLGVAALAALGTAIATVTGRYLWVFGEADNRLPLDYMPQILQAEPFEGTEAWLSNAPLWLRLTSSVSSFIALAILILAGRYIHRVLDGIAMGAPFGNRVLKSWKSLSSVLIFGGVAQGLANTLTFVALYQISFGSSGPAHIGTDLQAFAIDLPQWPWWTLLLGIVTQALFLAFKSGAKLEEDTTGLV